MKKEIAYGALLNSDGTMTTVKVTVTHDGKWKFYKERFEDTAFFIAQLTRLVKAEKPIVDISYLASLEKWYGKKTIWVPVYHPFGILIAYSDGVKHFIRTLSPLTINTK